jgi:hypothetical protein
VIFPYVTIPKVAPPRPYLEVVLRNGGYTSQILLALVDSGADYPIFPMEIATEFLRLDLTKAQRWTFSGTTGQPQTALLAEVHLSVLHSKDKVFSRYLRPYSINRGGSSRLRLGRLSTAND